MVGSKVEGRTETEGREREWRELGISSGECGSLERKEMGEGEGRGRKGRDSESTMQIKS